MTYRATIGLEAHVQLRTRSKMFCGCRTDHVGPQHAGLSRLPRVPGTLP